MSAINQVVGLLMLGAGLSVVLWASGRATPVIDRVAGIISNEVATGGAGGADWGG